MRGNGKDSAYGPRRPFGPNPSRAGLSAPVSLVLAGFGGKVFFAFEKRPNFGLPEPAVTARGTDTAYSAGGRPTRDRLGVDAEKRSHLARRQQTISSFHNHLLASMRVAVQDGARRLRWDVRPLEHRRTGMSDKQ